MPSSMGDYGESINCQEEPPLPAFSGEDGEWMEVVLREKNLLP